MLINEQVYIIINNPYPIYIWQACSEKKNHFPFSKYSVIAVSCYPCIHSRPLLQRLAKVSLSHSHTLSLSLLPFFPSLSFFDRYLLKAAADVKSVRHLWRELHCFPPIEEEPRRNQPTHSAFAATQSYTERGWYRLVVEIRRHFLPITDCGAPTTGTGKRETFSVRFSPFIFVNWIYFLNVMKQMCVFICELLAVEVRILCFYSYPPAAMMVMLMLLPTTRFLVKFHYSWKWNGCFKALLMERWGIKKGGRRQGMKEAKKDGRSGERAIRDPWVINLKRAVDCWEDVCGVL